MYQDLKLSDRARVIKMAVESGLTDLDTIEKVYNTFAQGGDLEEEPPERRKVGDHYLTLEQYKELQRDTIRKAAVQKALTRNVGVAPIINGEPASSCIYTFTDNYGRKYQVAGTQTFAANPEKYGFEVAGPVTKGMEGNMYLQLNESGVPYHATMITGYTDKGEPLLTYSSGHAGVDLTGVPISREDWDRNQRAAESLQRIAGLTPERETYEHYVERFNRSHSPEADYHKNTKAWHSPQYETYRFIGTPDDNALWEQQFNEFQPALIQVGVPQVLNNQVQTEFKSGGPKKRETAYARKYREEQIAKTRRAVEHPTLSNVFRNDTTDNNEKYYDIVKSRYDSIMGALRRKGFSYEDASRLAPMMVTQNVLEGGWRMSRPDNNFGGMQVNGRFLSFDSPDDYYDAYIDMLDQKWGQSKVKSKNWRNAENLNDWARIVNHEDLNLWSEERYNDYTKEHPNESIYLYAPEWQNNYKPYRQHLAGVEPRVNTYLDMIFEENPYTKEMYNAPIEPVAQPNDGFNLSMDQFQKLLKSNKSDGHMAEGGRLFEMGGPEKQNWFTRMMMNSVLNDPKDGAVAVSAGWTRDKNGNVIQTEEAANSEGAKKLRENLAEIASMPLTDLGIEVAGAAIAGTKAYKSYKLAKELNKVLKSGEFDAALKTTEEASAPVVKAATTNTKAANVATKSISGKDVEVQALRNRFNKWAEYYGYDTIPESASIEEAKNIMKKTFDRHNTFFRGVHPPETKEDVAHLEEIFGKGFNIEDAYPYIATHGRPGDGAVFVSPLSNAGIYGSTGKTAVVRRNYSLGENPRTWLQDADFEIKYGGRPEQIEAAAKEGTLTFPWSEAGHNIVENELLAPDGVLDFIEYVPEGAPTSYFDANGSLNRYLGKQWELYGGRQVFLDEMVPKPKFASGGKIHIKPENRGKFTALKKRTGHSASWFKAHGTPAQKKMAVFALNAKKWKHGDGGYLMTKL